MAFEPIVFRGQPAIRLAPPSGGACVVALHGAQLLSWQTPDGVERIYLSPEARFDGSAAIRGGIPVCWPQFNQRGPLQKHGFARNLPWALEADPSAEPAGRVAFTLGASDATRALWPHAFRVRLAVEIEADSLCVTLQVLNTGASPWSFAAALHTYLRVDDIAEARLEGLEGAQRWDAVRDRKLIETDASLAFGDEFDSVYAAPQAPLRLVQPRGTLEISQSASCTETVVWNPGPALSASLADMPDDGYRHMLCVEAARIDENILLAPQAQWEAWQRLTVL
ncbi:putative glucose-6-phosphate 1-epimerase [Burkholderiales bacterium 8X]|nr:putative glucose-6-phosphate 1-epimerase [Burkholderiales bacterium 8X]